jgi:ATP-dependent RNA helicase DeaD
MCFLEEALIPTATVDSPTETPARRRRARSSAKSTSQPPAPLSSDLEAQSSLDIATPGFAALGLSQIVLTAIGTMGFATPTPIQERAIPPLIDGRDVVGRAQTGTGKTLAFAAPIASMLDPDEPSVQAIVLVPTRELAHQVFTETSRVCQETGLRVLALFGGRRVKDDLRALTAGAHVVIGTPGRVIDHLRRGTLRLERLRVAVLDEADEMLDIGFADDIEAILRRTPKERQTALFSATMPPFIRTMIRRYLRNPVYVAIAQPQSTLSAIDQVYYEVSERDKLDGLLELLADEGAERVLCFRRTQIGVDRLTHELRRRGVPACGLHGGMSQVERDKVMHAYRARELRVLIATNVAARGLDIPDVSHVVNFDMPQNTEEYVHRIGRTGRAGRTGKAVTFVGEWDLDGLGVLQRFVGPTLRHGRLALYGS